MSRTPPDEEFTTQSPWLDLVNSQHWDGFGRLTDHLSDARWIARFLKYWRVRADQLGEKRPRGELVRLRSVLRRSIEEIAADRSLVRPDVDALNAFLNAPAYRQLTVTGKALRTELRPVRLNWKWIRAQIVASFVEASQDHPDRIKVCGNPECRWAFVDATRGNIRRWCKDRRCGNRDRVRRARARNRG